MIEELQEDGLDDEGIVDDSKVKHKESKVLCPLCDTPMDQDGNIYICSECGFSTEDGI